MFRISLLSRSHVTPEMAALDNKACTGCGNAPDMFRVIERAKPGEGGCAA
jgi:hypothetical protein